MIAVSGAQSARSCGTARDEACYSVPWLAQHGARLFRDLRNPAYRAQRVCRQRCSSSGCKAAQLPSPGRAVYGGRGIPWSGPPYWWSSAGGDGQCWMLRFRLQPASPSSSVRADPHACRLRQHYVRAPRMCSLPETQAQHDFPYHTLPIFGLIVGAERPISGALEQQ